MPKKVDWYFLILAAADAKGCIINFIKEGDGRECWLIINGKKYKYRGWKVPLKNEWLQAIYLKKKDKLELLTDNQVKALYDEIDGLETVLDEY